MTDFIGTILVALIGGAVVYITTGPALGATRSRKAVRELLEIRSGLDQGDSAHREAVDRILAKEMGVLEAMGDTRQRLLVTGYNAAFTLFVTGVVMAAAGLFVPSESLKDVVKYVGGASFLLSSTIPPLLLPDLWNRQTTRRSRLRVAVVLCGLSATSLLLAVLSVYGTTYMDQLIESLKPA